MKKVVVVGSVVMVLSGCVSLDTNRSLDEQKSYIDKTVSVPSHYFRETPQSKSVTVGSHMFAQAAGCHFMQRYKVRTTANFTDTLNLIKYRSALMGAKRISIVKHEELDANENRINIRDENVIYMEAGTSLQGAPFHTTIVADLYDCGG
jgi:hypothetical protein